MAYHRKEEALCRELGDNASLARCCGYQASIHAHRGDYREALRLYQEQEKFCIMLDRPDGLISSLANQARIIARTTSKYLKAEKMVQKAVTIAKKRGYGNVLHQLVDLRDRIGRLRMQEENSHDTGQEDHGPDYDQVTCEHAFMPVYIGHESPPAGYHCQKCGYWQDV